MTESDKKNGWDEWKNYVLQELGKQDAKFQLVYKKLDDISMQVATIKIRTEDCNIKEVNKELLVIKMKSGFWGLLAGTVPTLIIVILYLIFKNGG